MSENELPPSKTDSHTIGTTRRRFLRMTGAAGLLSTTLCTTGTAALSDDGIGLLAASMEEPMTLARTWVAGEDE